MSAELAALIGGFVLVTVQLLKWAGWPTERAPLAVLVVSVLFVAVYAWSQFPEETDWRLMAWPLVGALVSVTAIAAGYFGFVRAGPELLASFKKPKTDTVDDLPA